MLPTACPKPSRGTLRAARQARRGEYFPDGTQRWHHGLSAAELQTLERHGVEVEG